MAIDPVVSAISRIGLAALFGWAALHKARDVHAFADTVRDYRLLPRRWAPAATTGLIATETAIAATLLIPSAAVAAGTAAALLLCGYSAAIGWNLARGRRHIDCGCLGPGRRQPLSGWLLVRNALLIAVSLIAALPIGTRAVGWIDAVSIAGGLAAVALLFASADQLAAEAHTTRLLSRRTTPSGSGLTPRSTPRRSP